MQKHVQHAERVIKGNKLVNDTIKMFSASNADYNARLAAYSQTLGRTAMLEDMAIQSGAMRRIASFAAGPNQGPGLAQGNLRGTTIIPATIMSYVTNIVPIFGIERDINTPSMDLQVIDFWSILSGDRVIPNLGKDKTFKDARVTTAMTKAQATAASVNFQTGYTITDTTPIVPNSVQIQLKLTGNQLVTIHDMDGSLYAPAGILDPTAGSNTVDYQAGRLTIKLANDLQTDEAINISYVQDIPRQDKVDKLMGDVKYYHIDAEPVVIPMVRSLVTDLTMATQGVGSPNELYSNLIEATYTKQINTKAIKALVGLHNGPAYTADLSNFNLNSGFYQTFIRSFQSLIVDGQSILGEQTYKGARITGILAGRQTANVFQYMTTEEGWIPNTQLGYFKDVIGWYNNIPVVRWEGDEVGENDIYLTHKTEDGQIGALARGMFISPTDLPEVFSFGNPTQSTNGMMSMEGIRGTDSSLVVKLTVKLPQSQFLTK